MIWSTPHRCRKYFLLIFTVLASFAATQIFLSASAAAQTWTLSWSDEFNGAPNSPINPQNWQYDTGILNVNNEAEYYCSPGSSTPPCDTNAPNAYIDGSGHLVIQAVRVNSGVAPYSGSWTSARLNSGNNLQSFQYGRIESSMSLPVGPGLWPAFWALGTNITSVGWPASGEIDYMENVPLSGGLGPGAISSTMHGGLSSGNCYCGGNGMSQRYTFPSNDPNGPDVTTFHTYGAIWSANMVQFYVDDPSNVFFVRTTSDVPSGLVWDFNHPFFLILNLSVGGTGSWPGPPDNTTPSPALMRVDYVRVYAPSAAPPPAMNAPAINVTAGQAGSSTVTIDEPAGSGRVYLACTTDAPKATCGISTGDTLNSHTTDFSSTSSDTATLTVTTTANTSARAGAAFTFVEFSIFGVVLVGVPFARRRRPGIASLLSVFSLLLLVSCGGSGGSSPGPGSTPNGTPPGHYTVTLNAYTISNTSGTPDTVLSVPLIVK